MAIKKEKLPEAAPRKKKTNPTHLQLVKTLDEFFAMELDEPLLFEPDIDVRTKRHIALKGQSRVLMRMLLKDPRLFMTLYFTMPLFAINARRVLKNREGFTGRTRYIVEKFHNELEELAGCQEILKKGRMDRVKKPQSNRENQTAEVDPLNATLPRTTGSEEALHAQFRKSVKDWLITKATADDIKFFKGVIQQIEKQMHVEPREFYRQEKIGGTHLYWYVYHRDEEGALKKNYVGKELPADVDPTVVSVIPYKEPANKAKRQKRA